MSLNLDDLSVYSMLSDCGAFLTGSRAFGVEGPDSDYDLAVCGDKFERLKTFLKQRHIQLHPSSYFEGSFKIYLAPNLLIKQPQTVNIIKCETKEEFEACISTTRLMQKLCAEVPGFKRLIIDKKRRIDYFQTILSSFQ